MSWSEAEVETILEEMRAGATMRTGGSRCNTTYYHQDGAWGYRDFDEGDTQEASTTEESMRELIARKPERFREILKSRRWRPFSAAFLAGERDAARELLRSALEYGDELFAGKMLDAVLAWPETEPAWHVVELIREKLSGFTAYHVFMGAACWDRSPETGLEGVAFAERLIAMVGDSPGCYFLRSAFHEQAGDFSAAERDMLLEFERTPVDDWHRESYKESLERLRELASDAN